MDFSAASRNEFVAPTMTIKCKICVLRSINFYICPMCLIGMYAKYIFFELAWNEKLRLKLRT